VAPVSAGEPGVPVEGPDRSAPPRGPGGLRAAFPRRSERAIAIALLIALAALALHFNARPRHEAFAAIPDTLRALLAAAVLFGICGFGLVRVLLPAPLRRYELLWVLPTGGCATGLALTVLGFAAVPYPVSLGLVLIAGAALSLYAVRSGGWPELKLDRLAWPTYLSFVVLAVALVPMLFVLHYAAPVGTGSDAHLATGTAEFLKHSYPTSINVHEPVNQMPPTWKSKYPIYYALAGVSSISGLATWQVLAPLAAALLALAAIGMFLVAREVFRAPWAVALAAMALAGLDRMALYTILNPYFNQTWGFFAMPFTVVLAWWLVQPGESWRSRRGTLVLLALFALVLAFAYPLAVPIPAVPILVFLWTARRRRVAAGERVLRPRDLYRGRSSLLYLIPLAALLAVPVVGVAQKAVSAAQVLAPGHSLASWGGDLGHFVPFNFFFSSPNSVLGWVLLVVIAALTVQGLAGQPRALAWGLGGLFVIGIALATYLRHRQFGYYFEFKLLAFIGPLVLLVAVLGAGRLRRAGLALVAILVLATAGSTVSDLKATGYQLPQTTIQLSAWARSLPQNASIRLDMWPPQQLWAAYFLDARPLCSQMPLLGTDYPHVPISRKADYIVSTLAYGRPKDAVGQPLRVNLGYALYRENPSVPGPSGCSLRRVDRIYSGLGHSLY
jgi:hypothetical protein